MSERGTRTAPARIMSCQDRLHLEFDNHLCMLDTHQMEEASKGHVIISIAIGPGDDGVEDLTAGAIYGMSMVCSWRWC